MSPYNSSLDRSEGQTGEKKKAIACRSVGKRVRSLSKKRDPNIMRRGLAGKEKKRLHLVGEKRSRLAVAQKCRSL